METKRPEKSEIGLNSQLMIFAPPIINTGIKQMRWFGQTH